MYKDVMFMIVLLLPLVLYPQTDFRALEDPVKLAGGDGNYYMQPICSPDGSMIAFTESNYIGLWVVNTDSRDLQQVSNESGAGYNFVWSPDSRNILSRVVKYEGPRSLNALKSFNLEDGTESNLSGYIDEKLGLPNWQADNGQIYFIRNNSIEALETDQLGNNKDETPLVYQQNSKIYSVSKSFTKQLIVDGKNGEIYLYVRVSPDGKKVTYKVMGGNLYSMKMDGTGITDLGVGLNARWSPDSQYLVYMINTDDGYRYLSSDIYISSADGKEKYQITNTDNWLEMNPDWSSDGKHIIFSTYEEGVIYRIKVLD